VTTADLERLSQPRAIQLASSEATAVEQARAVAEVAAAVRVAQDCPRDTASAIREMQTACSQPALAERAFFSLPRAGGKIEGSTVHLARELARCWGNLDYGIRELRRDDEAGVSEMQAWAWDQQANVRSSRSFVVPHAIMAGKGADKRRKALTDLGDIANNNNSVAARAVRETIFTVLPVWFREQAESIASKTLQGEGDGRTPDQRKADAVAHYEQAWNVTRDQLEKRLGRTLADWTSQDIGFLQVLTGEMSRGEKRVENEFPTEQASLVTADDIEAQVAANDPSLPKEAQS
jgi:hypothetical protein